MMIGQLIVNGGGSPAPMPVYTPWLPVKGMKAVFSANVLQVSLSGGGKVELAVETKFSTEVDSNAVTAATGTATGAQVISVVSSAELKELYRYTIGFDASAGSADWSIVQTLDPVWQPTVS